MEVERLESLWGDDDEEIEVVVKVKKKRERTKKILDKIANPVTEPEIISVDKVLKSKQLSIHEKLALIREKVYSVLGKQINRVQVIKTKEEYLDYIDLCIKNGIAVIDTETNNSTDTITCKLMGLCLYTPGDNVKQVYVPVNHRNPDTKERLDWQLTEEDIAEGLNRLEKAKTKNIFHNAKFDYQVLKQTCGVPLSIYWDTLLGAKIIDENEFSAGLKQQYIAKIDPEQEKYSIDELYNGIEYADVDPELFALYAATDSYMTYKLFEYQYSILSTEHNKDLLDLLFNVEFPCITVTAEMELAGIEIDKEYSKKLQEKYHKRLDAVNGKIKEYLLAIDPEIKKWKLTKDAIDIQWESQTEKQYKKALGSKSYDSSKWKVDGDKYYKLSKSKLEQWGEDEEVKVEMLDSPKKLAILIYDILKYPVVDKEKPRGTGAQILKDLNKLHPNQLCDLMLQKRVLDKLLNAFIDTLPEELNVDNRIHCSFNQYGAKTGRYSCSNPNLQQIPSHNKEIRMMFRASVKYNEIESEDNTFIVPPTDKVQTNNGWKYLKDVDKSEKIKLEDIFCSILELTKISERGDYKLVLAVNA